MMLGIVSTGETKNMLNFFEVSTGANVCLMKTDFIKAVEQLKIWRERQDCSSFSCMLFCMFCKADNVNKVKFFHGFPAEMTAYLLWYHSNTEEEFFEKWGNIKIEEPEVIDPEKDEFDK